MKKHSYREIIDFKSKSQSAKESALRDMSAEDWSAVDKKFREVIADGKAPPKMSSRRRYEASDLAF